MVVELSGRQVFLASPGSLESERASVRARIDAFNRTHGWPQGVHFIDRGWERDVPGGVGRPQERINAVLDECDYMILLFAERWGSDPGGGGGYTSGTEEEFHHARELLADASAHLRDVLVLFHLPVSDAISTQDAQMKRVADFRSDVEATKKVLYEVWDSDDSLRSKVDAVLAQWSKPLEARTTVEIPWPPSRPSTADGAGKTPVERAIELANAGVRSQAEAILQQESAAGNRTATLEFARLARRAGRWDTSVALNELIIGDDRVLLSEDPQQRILLANALSNIGIIDRKRGQMADSGRRLGEAVATARAALPTAGHALAYALDNLGHTRVRQGLSDEARTAFNEALAVRGDAASPDDRLQSEINMARADLQAGNFDRAATEFSKLLSNLPEDADRHLVANLCCGLAEARLRQGDSNVGELLSRAQAANESVNSVDGLSITFGLGVRKALADENAQSAERLLHELEAQTGDSEDLSGRGTALVLRGQLALLRNDPDAAARLLGEARELAAAAWNPLLDVDISALSDALAER